MVIGTRYEVVREIGAGGMGQVFEVRHTSIGRRFALKIIRIGNFDDEVVRRFEREARALALVESPRVAQVTDFGVEEGVGPYLVMEYVPGPTLEERINDTTTFVDIAALAADTAEALADIHEAGLVHRDIKPANLAIGAHPVPVKLLDFGLATSVDDSYMTRITQSQQVLGSLPYLAPEQFAGDRPKPAQDLWALGIMIYEMAVGDLPFVGTSTAAVMHKILTAPAPVSGEVPDPLWHVITELLTKDPAKRPNDARALAARLRAIPASELAGAPKPRAATFQEGNQPGAPAASGAFLSGSMSPAPNAAPNLGTAPTASGWTTATTWVLPGVRPGVRIAAAAVVLVGLLLAGVIVWISLDDTPAIAPIPPGASAGQASTNTAPHSASASTPGPQSSESDTAGSTNAQPAGAEPATVEPATEEPHAAETEQPDASLASAEAASAEAAARARAARQARARAERLARERAAREAARQAEQRDRQSSGSQTSSGMSEWGGDLVR